MSQHDRAAQQGNSIVKSFALQLDSDSDAASVYSNGIESPPQERRAEEREEGRADSARRATLAALGLVPGPPPPVPGTPAKPSRGAVTPRNHLVSQQISPTPSSEASPNQSALHKEPGHESPPGGFARGLQSPSQALPPALPASSSTGGFGISPFSKVSENIAGLTKPSSPRSELGKEQRKSMSSGAPQQQGKQPVGLSESEGAEEKPLAAVEVRGHSPPKSGSESESSALARIPSSPFEAAQSMPIEEQPFVSPVPPVRTKAPSNSPQSSTSRGSSRFQDRYTSPTTTRIVDELLDEVVAHRLTPRDVSGSGRNNEPPMRPRGRSSSGDERDLPRMGKQEGNRGNARKEYSSFSDAGQATPSASGGSDLEATSSRGSAGPQSLSPGREGRSSSIGEELKMVMKSERAGRLARDSAEILVGDRPGEFTVVTQEGSSIPVDVRDLTESTSCMKDPLAVPASHSELQQPAPPQGSGVPAPAAASLSSQQQASALHSADLEPLGGSEPAPQAASDQGSTATMTTWLGSMMAAGTAALGLKGGAPADTGTSRSVQPAAATEPAAPSYAGASAAPAARQEGALPGKEGAAEAREQPPVLNIASTEPKAELSPVSAFASEVAVQPVCAATTDSSPIEGMAPSLLMACNVPPQGRAAESTSAVASPPVAEVRAPEAQEEADSFADAMSLECVQKESSLAGKPLDRSHVAHPASPAFWVTESGGEPSAFEEALGLEELSHRRQPGPVSPMATAGSNVSDAMSSASAESAGFLGGRRHRRSNRGSTEFIDEGVNNGVVADPSHRASVDFSGRAPGSAVEHVIGHMMSKPGRGPELPILPEPSDENSHDLTGSPIGDTVTSSEPVRSAGGPGSAPVTAERTRSEAAFLEAMPLMLPQKKKPASRKPTNSQRPIPEADSAHEALPLENSRPQSRPSAAAQPQAQAASGPQSPSWEQAVPLEMTRRRPSPMKVPAQPEKGEGASASAWEEAAPLERVKRSSRSSPSASPRTSLSSPTAATPSRSSRRSRAPPADVDITEEAQLQDPSLDRSDSLYQKLPLMANLSGAYSLESSGTERYDLYIDRAAAYDKAQQHAHRNSRQFSNKSAPTKRNSSGSLSSTAAMPLGQGRRSAHMGGIAAGTQSGSIHGHHEEPDIDMPEPDTPASDDSDSDEAEGNNIYYPSKSKGGEKGEGEGSIKELVGVAHVSPPQSAFASAQPPRSVFADAQMPVSDSEAEPDSARSHRRSFDQPKANQVEDTNNVAGGKASGKHKTVKKKGFCSCFG